MTQPEESFPNVGKRIEEDSKKVTPADIQAVLAKTNELRSIFAEKHALTKFSGEFEQIITMLEDYSAGKYKDASWWSVSAAVAALNYILNPYDIIPDNIPNLGFLDDAMMLTAYLSVIEKDLKKYREWKKSSK